MTSSEQPMRSAPPATSWREELRETARLSLPMALTQLGQIAMMTTDLAMIGRLGAEAVAAAALAHTLLFVSFALGLGLASAVSPLVAQAHGAGDARDVTRAVQAGLWTVLITGAPLTALQLAGEPILIALGQERQTAALAGRYLAGLGWCLIPAWAFLALRGFMGALDRPMPALWITLVAIPANALLAYALIHGALGMPRLDILGAGIATTIVNLSMLAATAWICLRARPFAQYRLLDGIGRLDAPLMRRLLAVGLPIAGAYLLEIGVFSAAALLMGLISTTALAAHQIALQVAAILFMIPFGVSLAATVRVGQALGQGDARAGRRAGFVAIAMGLGVMAALTMVIAATRHRIPGLFLGDGTAIADVAATAELVAALLLLGVTFFMADGTQTVAAGALRGLQDTRVPMLIAAMSFWGVGFLGAVVAGFALGLGARGVWMGLSAGLIVYAVLLVWRFDALTRRRVATSPPRQ